MQRNKLPLYFLAGAAMAPLANATPVANDDSATTNMNESVVIHVLANDTTDLDAPLRLVSFDNRSAHGTITRDEGSTLRYTPDPGFVGTDTFHYTMDDGDYGGSGDDCDPPTVVEDEDETMLSRCVDEPATHPLERIESTALVTIKVIGPSSLTEHTEGENDRRVSSVLDAICSTASVESEGEEGKLAQRCSALYTLAEEDSSKVDAIINQLAPEETLSLLRVASETSQAHTNRIFKRMSSLRQDNENIQVTVNGRTWGEQVMTGGAAGDAQTSPFGVFLSLHRESVEHDRTDRESAYEYDNDGFTLGSDYRVSQNLLVGAALGWGQNDLSFSESGGGVDADAYNLTGYGSYYIGNFGLDMQVGYGAGDYNTKRRINYTESGSEFSATAKGETDSKQLNLALQASVMFNSGALSVQPFLRLNYSNTEIDSFDETGGEGWSVHVGEQNLDQMTTSAGFEATYPVSYNWGVLQPSFQASAVSESSTNFGPVKFHFIGDSDATKFELSPDGEDSLYYIFNLGAVAVMKNGVSAFIDYQQNVSYDNSSAYQINTGLRYEL